MYELKKWHLCEYQESGWAVAHGLVWNKPQFPDGTDIHTSIIEKVLIDEENEQFMVITRSQSYYILKFAEMNMEQLEKTRASGSLLNIPDEILEKGITCAKNYQDVLFQEINAKLRPKELYLIMAGATAISAYYKRANHELVVANIDVHLGTTQDSVLIAYQDELDFCYFPKGHTNNVVQPYQWAVGLDKILIKNIGRSFQFRGTEDCIFSCEPGGEMGVEYIAPIEDWPKLS